MLYAAAESVGPAFILEAVLFMLATAAFGTIAAWLRLGTGSLWPPILLHAMWNAVINGAFSPASVEAGHHVWTGEGGVLAVLALGLAVWSLWREWAPAPAPARAGG